MIGATLFSGLGAPECAAPFIDWRWCAEIEPFPAAVHRARFPACVNLGDVTAHDFPDRAAALARPDVLVFGSPCQSFSIAGKRLGLDDPRGNLALHALRLARELRPRWLVFENVPGLLSSGGGRDFGAFLGLMGQCGFGWAYRILDAQFAGVPQRRRRVFVVGYFGDWRPPAAVLFERESLRGDSPPRREAREAIAGALGARTGRSRGAQDASRGPMIAHALRGDGFDASEDGTGRGTPLIAFSAKDRGADALADLAPTLRAGGHAKSHANAGVMPAVAFAIQAAAARESPASGPDGIGVRDDGCAYTLEARAEVQAVAVNLRGRDGGAMPETSDVASLRAASGGSSRSFVQTGFVRRLTPRECERLQGFPDDWTAITYRGKPAADGPRYKAIGNAMAVPVIGWILRRIVDADATLAAMERTA